MESERRGLNEEERIAAKDRERGEKVMHRKGGPQKIEGEKDIETETETTEGMNRERRLRKNERMNVASSKYTCLTKRF